MTVLLPRFRLFILSLLLCTLCACSRPVPFSAYIAEQLLLENLNSLTDPPLFEVKKIDIISVQAEDTHGSASADIVLLFPQSLIDIASQQQLDENSMALRQYKSSFGEFVAGEIQRHHARYEFQKRGKKWVIRASQPLAAPTVIKP